MPAWVEAAALRRCLGVQGPLRGSVAGMEQYLKQKNSHRCSQYDSHPAFKPLILGRDLCKSGEGRWLPHLAAMPRELVPWMEGSGPGDRCMEGARLAVLRGHRAQHLRDLPCLPKPVKYFTNRKDLYLTNPSFPCSRKSTRRNVMFYRPPCHTGNRAAANKGQSTCHS